MPRFRKKPVEIEAVQWRGGGVAALRPLVEFGVPYKYDGETGLEVLTLEGPLHASAGDWIIRGVRGEFYPCKPDIFAATYDPVT